MKFQLFIPQVIRKAYEPYYITLSFESNSNLQEILRNFLQERYDLIFNDDGSCKGFAKCFYKNDCIDNLSEISLSDGDEIEIVMSMSGG